MALREVRHARHQMDNRVPEVHPVGTFFLPHNHEVREDWPVGLKQRVANHIDTHHERVAVGSWGEWG